MKIEGKFYDRTTTPEDSEDGTAVPSMQSRRPDSYSPRPQDYRAWWRRKVSFMYEHMCPCSIHISVSGVDSRSLWSVYPGVLSDTPTECVTQCANVPSLKQNIRHHAKSRICAGKVYGCSAYHCFFLFWHLCTRVEKWGTGGCIAPQF